MAIQFFIARVYHEDILGMFSRVDSFPRFCFLILLRIVSSPLPTSVLKLT